MQNISSSNTPAINTQPTFSISASDIKYDSNLSDEIKSDIYRYFSSYIWETKVNINDLCELIADGYYFAPAVFNGEGRKKVDILSQQVIVIDIDNGLSLIDFILKTNKLGIPPQIIYTTEHHKKYKKGILSDRYRAVWVLDTILKNYKQIDDIIKTLNIIFNGDTKINSTSLFKPGKIIKKNYSITPLYDLFLICKDAKDKSNIHRFYKLFPQYMLNDMDENNIYMTSKNEYAYINNTYSDLLVNFNNTYPTLPLQTTFNGGNNRLLYKGFIIKLQNKCKIFKKIENGDGTHSEWVFIFNVLRNIDGGETYLRSIIPNHKHDNLRFLKMNDYLKGKRYSIQCCSSINCPHMNECNCSNIDNPINVVRGKNTFIYKNGYHSELPIEQIWGITEGYFNEAIESSIPIHIIKSICGGRKTECHVKSKYNFIVAVSNHLLADDIERRYRDANKAYIRFPKLPALPDDIAYEYALLNGMGDYSGANSLLYNKRKYFPIIDEYMSKVEECKKEKNKSVIMCHERLSFTDFLEYSDDERMLVIDEDCTNVFNATDYFTIDTLQRLIDEKSFLSDILEKIRDEILNTEKETYVKTNFCVDINLLIRCVRDANKKFSKHKMTNIINFFMSDYWIRLDDRIQYIRNGKLDTNGRKTIILSATIDVEYAKRTFLNGMNVDVHEVPRAKQLANVIFNNKYSLTKKSMQGKNAIQYYTNMREKYSDNDWIGLKEYAREGEFYHRALEGNNSLKGKNIVVCGSNPLPSFQYGLMACLYLDKPLSKEDMIFGYEEVSINGHKMKKHVFKNEIVRELYLHDITSLQEQAIGRTRPYENKSTVVVLSNIPPVEYEVA